MKKRIKTVALTAILGLSTSFINQLAALASDSASDKTTWLTNNISNKSETTPQPIELQALSASLDNKKSHSLKTIDTFGRSIKLRPFMPNRKLPSRHDIELALIEQKAQMAAENNARLNGQVSAFATSPEPDTNLLQDQNINYLRPITRTNKVRNNQVIARTTKPTITQAPPVQNNSPTNTAQNFSFMKQAEQHLLSTIKPAQTPIAPAYPQMSLEETKPQISGFGTAGPPPFPLNLLPEAALKQLIRSMAMGRTTHAGNAPRAYFGSWHSSAQVSNLPQAGFQSYTGQVHSFARYRRNNHNISALPAVTASPIRSRNQNSFKQNANKTNSKDTAARNRLLLESQVRVASYPAYATQSLSSWGFAQ